MQTQPWPPRSSRAASRTTWWSTLPGGVAGWPGRPWRWAGARSRSRPRRSPGSWPTWWFGRPTCGTSTPPSRPSAPHRSARPACAPGSPSGSRHVARPAAGRSPPRSWSGNGPPRAATWCPRGVPFGVRPASIAAGGATSCTRRPRRPRTLISPARSRSIPPCARTSGDGSPCSAPVRSRFPTRSSASTRSDSWAASTRSWPESTATCAHPRSPPRCGWRFSTRSSPRRA